MNQPLDRTAIPADQFDELVESLDGPSDLPQLKRAFETERRFVQADEDARRYIRDRVEERAAQSVDDFYSGAIPPLPLGTVSDESESEGDPE